jgi:hypothetical protein
MRHFLLVFDRAEGRLLREESFADRSEALSQRFAAERLHGGDPRIEVVVLSAASAAALRKTHSRYFRAPRALAEASLAQARAHAATDGKGRSAA